MAETEEKIPLSHSQDGVETSSRYFSFKKRTAVKTTKWLVIVLIILLVVLVGVLLPVLLLDTSAESENKLANSVSEESIMRHLQMLNDIAENNTNSLTPSRSVLNQYNASAEYIISALREVGYEPYTQAFQVPVNMEYGGSFSIQTDTNPPYSRSYVQKFDFDVMRYSGNGTAAQRTLKTLSGDAVGCDEDNYSDLIEGDVILIQYNTNCTYYDKAKLAADANVGAIIFYWNEINAGLLPSRSRVIGANLTDFIDLPIVSATYGVGRELLNLMNMGTVEVSIETLTSVTIAWTYNVFADTAGGRNDRIIVFGSHLDSVPEGPGINDNGSGSATNLEVAIQVAKQKFSPTNKVRFAWWGGEELGLLGSKHYVEMLGDDEKGNHSLNLNFDMLGSPNFVRYVYTYENSAYDGPEYLVHGCEQIQKIFEDRFKQKSVPYKLLPFTTGSDYASFIKSDVDIPAGALATGAGGMKTVEERKVFGGFPNAALDTCYHQLCDTVSNIDEVVLSQMADAAAYTLQQLMMMDDLCNYLYNGTITC